MITLYRFGPLEGAPDASPFCVKVEAYLRMAKLPYQTVCGPQYLQKAPKKKLPYIDDDGRKVADSSAIIRYLKATYGDPLDGSLSNHDQAIAHAFGRMIDEHLYWVLVHARWQLDENWQKLKMNFFGDLPIPLSLIVPAIARRNILSQIYQQGMGRHSAAEIAELGNQDLKALADFLGSKPYFFGNEPTSLDAVAFGSLVQFYRVRQFSAPIIDHALNYPNLVDFTDRFQQRYFADTFT